jgi:UDP-galactopyranose mutase
MGRIRIKVEVGNVYPPKPIRVFIDSKSNDKDDYEFKSPRSFDQEFDVPQGTYTITISGMNQKNDKTDVEVSGDFSNPGVKTSSAPNYSIVYKGKIDENTII